MERYQKQKKTVVGKPFPKGVKPEGAGRRVGSTNRIPTLFKECIELASKSTGRPEPLYAPKMNKGKVVMKNGKPVLTSVIIGWKATGKNGVVGYMEWLALYEPKAFCGLIARTMPLQINAKTEHSHTVTSRFKDVDTSKMSLAELAVAFRECVGLTQPLPSKPKLVEHHAGMLLEGAVVDEDEEAA